MSGKCILSRNTPSGHKLTCTILHLEEYGLLRCDTMLSGRNIPTIMKGPAVPSSEKNSGKHGYGYTWTRRNIGYEHGCFKRKSEANIANKKKCTLEQVMKAERGSRCIALLFFTLGTSWSWVVNATPWLLFQRPNTHRIGRWLGPMAVGMGVENLATTRIPSLDHPARSKLY